MSLKITDPTYWYKVGKADRDIGNNVPGMTVEDFCREIDNRELALECADAYLRGFNA